MTGVRQGLIRKRVGEGLLLIMRNGGLRVIFWQGLGGFFLTVRE